MTWTTLPVSDRAPDGTSYDLIGPAGAPCIVLIHGLGLSRKLWEAHLPAFADYRILRYDLYGHGESAPPPEPASLSVFAKQLSDLMALVGIVQAHIVGFSIGGMINRRFALDFPDQVASLVIMNSPHDRGPEAQRMVEDRAKLVRAQGAFSTFDAALERWFTPEYLKKDDGPERVREWRGQVDGESYAQTAWVLAHGVRELISPEYPISARSLVITCENDSGSTPQMSHDMAAEIDGARVLIVPSYRHLGLMEDPKAFVVPVVDFIDQIEGEAVISDIV